jgi:hypothetical protein
MLDGRKTYNQVVMDLLIKNKAEDWIKREYSRLIKEE